jgi:hypothetical protein
MKQIDEGCNCKHTIKKIVTFAGKTLKPKNMTERYSCSMEKIILEKIDNTSLNKKAIVQYIKEDGKLNYVKGIVRIASNKSLREGYDIEVVSGENSIPMKLDNVVSMKYMSEGMLREFKSPSKQRKLPKLIVNKTKRVSKLKSKMKTIIKENLLVKEENTKEGKASYYRGMRAAGNYKMLVPNNEHYKDKDFIRGHKNTLKYGAEVARDMFHQVNEEIVNKEHAGTMSKKEISSRDRIAKKVKANPIKKGDTAENAKYRLATYIELRKRGGKKEKPVKSGKKKKAKKDKE